MVSEDIMLSMDALFLKCSDIEINCINWRVLILEGPNKNFFFGGGDKNSFVDMYKNA
jgi:hypothetical protein